MASSFQSLTINDTGNLTLPSGTSANRASLQSNTAIQWTNTGSQAYSTLAGSPGTVSNTSWTCPTGVTSIEVLVVAGGGQGGSSHGGGGGGGGVIYNSAFPVVPGTAYTVTVGVGGYLAQSTPSQNGTNSVFGPLTALGGGAGTNEAGFGLFGGSGGGGGGKGGAVFNGGYGQPGQGNPGGKGTDNNPYNGGGGGGAGAAGANAGANAGNGGNGLNFSISGTPTWYAGGGGGNAYGPTGGTVGIGGQGGGGNGGIYQTGSTTSGTVGTASTGGGGGGNILAAGNLWGMAGGSGTVIIRYTLATTTSQPFGQTRLNTAINTLETFTGKNVYTGSAIMVFDPGVSYPGSGSTLNDLSGYGNNASIVASPTYTSSNGGYFTFNGTSQYLRVPISDSINTCQTGITMISWIYPTAWNSGMAWNNHIQGATNYGAVSGAIQNLGASGNLNIQTRINNFCCQTLSMNTTASLSTWFQYVSVWDGGCLYVYMNGVLQQIGQPTYGTLQMINDMYFGVNADTIKINSTTVNMYTGRLGWAAIYNRGLTADEINLNFQTYRSRYGI
jgi:hypothetical protein